MEAIIFIGIQATGKSTFYKTRFFDSHIRINLDMLKTRHRENLLLHACLEMKQPFVIDNTNPTRKDRIQYIAAAQNAGFRIHGYYFRSNLVDSIRRNDSRNIAEQIPEIGIRGTFAKLEIPSFEEGFDALFYVSLVRDEFRVEEWKDEV